MTLLLRSAMTRYWLPGLLCLAPAANSRPALAPSVDAAAPGVASSVVRRPMDAAARVEFTVTGGGHQNERVLIRDAYPEQPPPFAAYHKSGIVMFGVDEPLLELRAGKLGPKLWAIHLIVSNTGGTGGLPVTSAEPELIYNGDNTHQQQSWFAHIVLPPDKRGTLTVSLLPGAPAGRLRGTFSGTLVDDAGNEVTVGNGSFDLRLEPRPD